MLSNLSKYKIILVSGSDRRKFLLEQIGLKFEIINPKVKEKYPETYSPIEVVKYLAKLKATSANIKLTEKVLLIAADTVVVLGNKILGKPKNKNDAIQILKELSGNKHEVISGVFIYWKNQEILIADSTIVYFDTLSMDLIEHYVNKFKPFDKAGAYGIQEWISYVGIKKIIGSYHNVMGLPIQKLFKYLHTIE